MRAGYAVLVPQAESVGALGVIRSLGRAGYEVHATATAADALGLHSAHARRATVSPAYDDEAFLPWLRAYVREHHIQAIVPSEGFLLALGPARGEFLALLPFAPDERTLMAAMSKHALLSTLLAHGAPHLPPTVLVDNLSRPPDLQRLGAPLYVKLDGCNALDGSGGVTRRCETFAEARQYLSSLSGRYSRAIVQGHVEGKGVAAFFLCIDGEVRAEMMHRRLHEVPWTGGVSSLRETWAHQAIRDDALEKLRLARFTGVAMMEYRYDESTGAFAFIEMNARFWGSLHLALHAGVDFPRLLLDAWRGLPLQAPDVPLGVRCRHLPLDIQHLWSKLKASELTAGRKLAAVAEFAALTLDPRVRSDLLFPGDRALLFVALRQFFQSLSAAKKKKAAATAPRLSDAA